MDRSTISNPHKLSGDCNTIRRVSRPWPARTKKALRRSLDEGIFEDFSVMVPPGSVSVKHLMHFAGVVDEVVSSSISHREFSNCYADKLITDGRLPVCRSEPTSQHDAETSLSRLVENIHIHFLTPHNRLVGRPLRTICTPIVSASGRSAYKPSNRLQSTAPQTRSFGGIYAPRERYFIWLARSGIPPSSPTIFDAIRVVHCMRRLNWSCDHRNRLIYDARERR